MSKKVFTDEETNFIKENYSSKGSKWCSLQLNKTVGQILSKASNLGIRVDKNTTSKIRSNNTKIFWENNCKSQEERPVNSNIFRSGNNDKNIAYICGLLWADGTFLEKNGRCFIELIEEDLSTLEHLFKETGNWWTHKRLRPNRKPQMIIGTCNKDLYNFFIELGYIKNRIDMTKAVQFFSAEVRNHWWRGYLDGDGCFYCNLKNYCYQTNFGGPYDYCWTSLEELLKCLNISCFPSSTIRVIREDGTKYSQFRFSGKENIKKFGDYIYQDSEGIRLERKYLKWLECTKIIERKNLAKKNFNNDNIKSYSV